MQERDRRRFLFFACRAQRASAKMEHETAERAISPCGRALWGTDGTHSAHWPVSCELMGPKRALSGYFPGLGVRCGVAGSARAGSLPRPAPWFST